MRGPVSIRLSERERATIEQAVRVRGLGISAFIRELVESEAQRLRRDQIRAEGSRLVERLAADQKARKYYEDADLPAGEVVP